MRHAAIKYNRITEAANSLCYDEAEVSSCRSYLHTDTAVMAQNSTPLK